MSLGSSREEGTRATNSETHVTGRQEDRLIEQEEERRLAYERVDLK